MSDRAHRMFVSGRNAIVSNAFGVVSVGLAIRMAWLLVGNTLMSYFVGGNDRSPL